MPAYTSDGALGAQFVADTYAPQVRLPTSFPKILISSRKQHVGSVDLEYEDLASSALQAPVDEIPYEVAPGPGRALGSNTLTISATRLQSAPQDVPLGLGAESYWRSMLRQADKALHWIEAALLSRWVTELSNTTRYTSSTFDGTGDLDAYPSDANPRVDILAAMDALMYLEDARPGLEWVFVVPARCAVVFAGYRDFQKNGGWFTTDGRSSEIKIDPSDGYLGFRTAFAAAFPGVRAENVNVISGMYNSAQYGQTASYADMIGATLGLWGGLVDRHTAQYDHRLGRDRSDVPSGAVASVFAVDEPVKAPGLEIENIELEDGVSAYVKRWGSADGSEVGHINAGTVHGIANPMYGTESLVAGFVFAGDEILTSP